MVNILIEVIGSTNKVDNIFVCAPLSFFSLVKFLKDVYPFIGGLYVIKFYSTLETDHRLPILNAFMLLQIVCVCCFFLIFNANFNIRYGKTHFDVIVLGNSID